MTRRPSSASKRRKSRRELGTGRQDPRRDRAAVKARSRERARTYSAERHLQKQITRLNALEWAGLCTMCERRWLDREYGCCEECYLTRTEEGRALAAYVPYDEWASQPTQRVLLALRDGRWAGAEEIGDILGLPKSEWEIGKPKSRVGQKPERRTLSKQIGRLADRGLLKRRQGPLHPEYHITQQGRALATYRVDMEDVCWE